MSSEFFNIFETAKKLENTNRSAAENKYTEFINSVEQAGSCDEVKERLASAYNNRGYLKYLAVDFDEASDDYTSCIKINPSFTVAYYNRGMVHYRLGRFDEAIKDLSQTLKLDPTFEEARIGLEKSKQDKENHNNKLKMGYFNT